MKKPLLKLIFLLTYLFISITCQAQKEKSKPNVLIIHVDQWRAQSIGYAGDKEVITPNLDALAKTSANFEKAISGLPVCTPHRASLMTGQKPLATGVFMNDIRLDTNAVTIAKVFSQQGYQTGYIGKWHLDGSYRFSYTPPGARRQGFNYWKAVNCDHDYNNSIYYDTADSTKKYWDGYDVFEQTEAADNYIELNARDKNPFFLMVAYGPPHNPYNYAPEKYKKLYDPAKITLRPNVPKSMANKVRKDLAGYYAHMTALDDMVGRLISKLKQQGVYENTIILFTSDHGDLLGSQGAYEKEQPYDESIRVPMLFHYPGKNGIKGSINNAMINSEDLMPTLLGLSNIKIPKTVEGVDFSKYLKGKRGNPKDTVSMITCIIPFGTWTRLDGGKEFRGIRTPRYTYVRDLNGPWLLFDNDKDPYQINNLVNKNDYELLQTQLNQILNKKLKANKDQFLPGSAYLKKFNYPNLDSTGTVPYFNQ